MSWIRWTRSYLQRELELDLLLMGDVRLLKRGDSHGKRLCQTEWDTDYKGNGNELTCSITSSSLFLFSLVIEAESLLNTTSPRDNSPNWRRTNSEDMGWTNKWWIVEPSRLLILCLASWASLSRTAIFASFCVHWLANVSRSSFHFIVSKRCNWDRFFLESLAWRYGLKWLYSVLNRLSSILLQKVLKYGNHVEKEWTHS